jgi:hypothetical protein
MVMGVVVMFVADAGKKGLAAVLGSCAGLLVAVAVVLAASGPLQLTGFPTAISRMLRQSVPENVSLDFISLLTCGTIVCILGIVLDLSVGIASAVEQLCREEGRKPREALRAGLRMSRDVTGTMLLTLIFVWAGQNLHAMMLPAGMGIPPRELLNTEAMAVEVLRLTAGGIGMLATGPATALIAVVIFARGRARTAARQAHHRIWPLKMAAGLEGALGITFLVLILVCLLQKAKPEMPPTPVPRHNDARAYHKHAQKLLTQARSASSRQHRRRAQAVVALWRALDMNSDYGQAHRTLAGFYVRQRWFVPAWAEARHALELMPDDSQTHYIAGVALAWLHQMEKARQHLHRALELNPDNTNASQALKALFGENP